MSLQRVYFNPNGFMRDVTSRIGNTLYVGKDRIPHYTIDHVVSYTPHAADAVFIVSDDEGHETTMRMNACHMDTRTRHTYIYSEELHRVFKFDLADTLFLLKDFTFFGEIPNQMCYAIPDAKGYRESLKLW